MATFDVRFDKDEEITEIVFAELYSNEEEYTQCHRIDKALLAPHLLIQQSSAFFVRVTSIEHAQNLIKALNKALELGWLK